MLRKIRLLFTITCLVLVAGTAFAKNSPTIQKILDRGKLIVAVHDADFPPMFSQDKNGKLVGHDIDLARYIAENLGVPVEFDRTAKTFDGVVDLVSEGKADIGISLLTPTLARSRKVAFSTPYLFIDLRLVYNRLTAAKLELTDPANQIRNISGLKIGIVKNSSFDESVRKYFPLATVVEYPQISKETLSDIESGKLFAFFGSSGDISYSLSQRSAGRLYFGASKLKDTKDPIAIAVSWEALDLLTWINLALQLKKLEHNITADLEKQYAL